MKTEQCLTVGSGGAVKSDLHGNVQPVLHHEGGADSDDLPGTALHRDGEDHSDRRKGRELGGRKNTTSHHQVYWLPWNAEDIQPGLYLNDYYYYYYY